MTAELLPTVDGCAPGIVSTNPITLQCFDCRATVTPTDLGLQPHQGAALVILSGYHFHPCEPDPQRRCRSCLVPVLAGCSRRPCQERHKGLTTRAATVTLKT